MFTTTTTGRHALASTLDAPAADWYLNVDGEPAMSLEDYVAGYNNRRPYASHRVATFPCNKFAGVEYPYRDQAFLDDVESFCELTNRSMISSSYGWLANRAYAILAEAYEEHEGRTTAAELATELGLDLSSFNSSPRFPKLVSIEDN